MQRSGGTYCKIKLNSIRTEEQIRLNRMKSVRTRVLILKSIYIYATIFFFEMHAILLYQNNTKTFFIICNCSNFIFAITLLLTVKINHLQVQKWKNSLHILLLSCLLELHHEHFICSLTSLTKQKRRHMILFDV